MMWPFWLDRGNSVRWAVAGKRNRCRSRHRADGGFVADIELYRALEAQCTLHARTRSNDDARHVAVRVHQFTRRLLNQDAAFDARCARDGYAAVDRLDSAAHMRRSEGDGPVHVRQRT